jgi:hypothetical protein
MATALACSGSRMGIASALLSLLVMGSLLVWRGRRRGFAAAAAAVAIVAVFLLSRGPVGASLLASFSMVGTELGRELGRASIWNQVVGMAAAFPALGIGMGAFPYVFPAFRTSGEGVALTRAHNDYLEFAAETGMVGCLLALAALALIGARVRRQLAAPSAGDPLVYGAAAGAFALALHSLADFNMAIPSNALTLSVLVGITLGSIQARGPIPALDARQAASRARRAWLPAGCLAVCAVLAVSPLPADAGRLAAFDRGNAGRTSQQALDAGGRALRDLRALVESRADGAPPSALAASYLERRLSEAIALQEQALRYLPTSASGHFALGRLRVGRCAAAALASGAPDDCAREALPEVHLALELNPMSAAMHAQVARFLMAAWPVLDANQRFEAEPIIERAARMNRGDRGLQERWAKIRDWGEAAR